MVENLSKDWLGTERARNFSRRRCGKRRKGWRRNCVSVETEAPEAEEREC